MTTMTTVVPLVRRVFMAAHGYKSKIQSGSISILQLQVCCSRVGR